MAGTGHKTKSGIRTLTSASGWLSSRATVLKTAVVEMEAASGSKLPESTGKKKKKSILQISLNASVQHS